MMTTTTRRQSLRAIGCASIVTALLTALFTASVLAWSWDADARYKWGFPIGFLVLVAVLRFLRPRKALSDKPFAAAPEVPDPVD